MSAWKTEVAERLADFIEVRNNQYDARRFEEPWASILERWRDTYEAAKSDPFSTFAGSARKANIEAINSILAPPQPGESNARLIAGPATPSKR